MNSETRECAIKILVVLQTCNRESRQVFFSKACFSKFLLLHCLLNNCYILYYFCCTVFLRFGLTCLMMYIYGHGPALPPTLYVESLSQQNKVLKQLAQ